MASHEDGRFNLAQIRKYSEHIGGLHSETKYKLKKLKKQQLKKLNPDWL